MHSKSSPSPNSVTAVHWEPKDYGGKFFVYNRCILSLNTLKTKEIVFHRPRLPNRTLPPLLPGIERVFSDKILGVTFTATLSPEQHINNIIAICNQRLYLLSQLKQQNLSEQALDLIFHAVIIFKIIYALPAFAGHISTAERNRINKFFRKAYRRHLVTQIFDIDTLIETNDSRLFRSITYPDHCLNYLLPSKCNYTTQLRPKGHNFTLLHIHTTLLKNSFINRCIFGIV